MWRRLIVAGNEKYPRTSWTLSKKKEIPLDLMISLTEVAEGRSTIRQNKTTGLPEHIWTFRPLVVQMFLLRKSLATALIAF